MQRRFCTGKAIPVQSHDPQKPELQGPLPAGNQAGLS